MCYFNYQLPKNVKKIISALKYLIPLLIIIYLAAYAFLPQSFKYNKKHILFKIKKGDSLETIAYKLYKKKAIGNFYLFYFIGFISGYSRYIEAGDYYLSPSESPAALYYKFVNGNIATARVTIPPGTNIFQMAKILNKNHIVKEKAFIKTCFNKDFLLSIGVNKKSIEGFLYPNTYIFKIDSRPKSIIKEMYNGFKSKTAALNLKYKDIIIASLIIKEAHGEKDMRTVSAVFKNRLKINMALDSDPTAIYGKDLTLYDKYFNGTNNRNKYIKNNNSQNNKDNEKQSAGRDSRWRTYKFPDSMKPSYLKIKSPYNTYLNAGLPPTPISNPNLQAINAALHPKKTVYLYFISTKNGKILFARTIKKQTYNINHYLNLKQ